MIRAFADASVIYSAINSRTGASRELLKRHKTGQIRLVTSQYALDETKRNIIRKAPELAIAVDALLTIYDLEIVEATPQRTQEAATYTIRKDAPIVAAAIDAGCPYLLSYDRQHLLGISAVEEGSGLQIITSGDLLQILEEAD